MKIIRTIISADSTKKYYFKADDEKKEHVEACLLNLPNYGYIICISSQIGCSQQCGFCASGCKPFIRNLSSLEMEEQVELIVNDNPSLYKNNLERMIYCTFQKGNRIIHFLYSASSQRILLVHCKDL